MMNEEGDGGDEEWIISKLIEKLRSFLMSDFFLTLQENEQGRRVLDKYREVASDDKVMSSFLLKLLPSENVEWARDDIHTKKKLLRNFTKVFHLPLGLRVTLVNQVIDVLSGWHSWSVVEGGVEEHENHSSGVGLSPMAVVLGECLSPNCISNGVKCYVEEYEVYCRVCNPRVLSMFVYNSHPEGKPDGSISEERGHVPERSDDAMTLERFLRLGLKWVNRSCGKDVTVGRLRHAFFVKYIKQKWCIWADVGHKESDSSLTNYSTISEKKSEDDLERETSVSYQTLPLDSFLLQGYMAPHLSHQDGLDPASLKELQLRAIDLLDAVCGSLEQWYPPADDIGDMLYVEGDIVNDSLRLSLQHFFVTFSSSCLPRPAVTTVSKKKIKSKKVAEEVPIICIVGCELQPYVSPLHRGGLDSQTGRVHESCVFSPPERFQPLMNTGNPSDGHSTSAGHFASISSSDDICFKEGSVHDEPKRNSGSDEGVQESSSPASTVASSSSSATDQFTGIDMLSRISDTYSLALMLCVVLKGDMLTPAEVKEFRKAHEYYSPDSSSIPSFYTANVENLVNTSMLYSCLWPESLREISNPTTLKKVLATRIGPDHCSHESYVMVLLDIISVLKRCLRFHPRDRLLECGENHNIRQLRQLFAVLRNMIVQDHHVDREESKKVFRSDHCEGGGALSHIDCSASYLVSIATMHRIAPSISRRISFVSGAEKDSGLLSLIPYFRRICCEKNANGSSISATWNFLVLSWTCGLLIRPAQVARLLTQHLQQHPHAGSRLVSQAYRFFFRQLREYCEGDVELGNFVEAGLVDAESPLGQHPDCGTWQVLQTCTALTAVESLFIDTLSIYLVNSFSSSLGANPRFKICVDSRLSQIVGKVTIAPVLGPSSVDLSASVPHGPTIEFECFDKNDLLYKDATCCVNQSMPSSSLCFNGIWLSLDSEITDIRVSDVNTNSILLCVGEVLDIQLRQHPHSNRTALLFPHIMSSSVASILVDKLMWCSAIPHVGGDPAANPSAGEDGDNPTTTKLLSLLLRGRWLHEDEYQQCHPLTSGHDSDAETVTLDEYEQGVTHDSDSEFSDHGSSPALLHMPYFIVIVELQEGCGKVRAVHMLRNIHHDQVPMSLTCLSSTKRGDDAATVIVTGSGGLLGMIQLPESDLASSVTNFVDVTHLSNDEYLKSMEYDYLPAAGVVGEKCFLSHSPNAVVTAISVSRREEEICSVFATGDSEGCVLLWRARFVDGLCLISLLSESPLQLRSSVEMLDVAPLSTSMPLNVVATTKTHCFLLSSNRDLVPTTVSQLSELTAARTTLFVKSLLDTTYNFSETHMKRHGMSLCPRYLSFFSEDDSSLFLWRIMRNRDNINEVVIAQRVVKLTNRNIPSYSHLLGADLAVRKENKQSSSSSLGEELCSLCDNGEEESAFALLRREGVRGVLGFTEMIALQTFLIEQFPLLFSHGDRYCLEKGIGMTGDGEHSTSKVLIRCIPAREWEKRLSRCRDEFNSRTEACHCSASINKSLRGDLERRAHSISSTYPTQIITADEFKAYHMSKLNVSHHTENRGPSTLLETSSSLSGFASSSTSNNLPSVPSPVVDDSNSCNFSPIFKFVSASHCGGDDDDDDLLAYVHRSFAKTSGQWVQRIRVFDKKNPRSSFFITAGDMVAHFLPCALAPSGGTHGSCSADPLTTELNVTALAFTSSGDHLIIAATLMERSIISSPSPSGASDLCSGTSVGIIVWSCVLHEIVGAVLHYDAECIGVLSDPGTRKKASSVAMELSSPVTDDSASTTPQRPSLVISTKPFGVGERDGQSAEVRQMVLSHGDTLLSVILSGGSQLLFALVWPSSCRQQQLPKFPKVGSNKRTLTHEEDDLLDRLDDSSKDYNKRYLLSSREYFSQLLQPLMFVKSSLGVQTSHLPGHRMSILLLNSFASWLHCKRNMKVFALQGSQGSGKTIHLQHLLLSLSHEDSPAMMSVCSLPTPATTSTAFTDQHADVNEGAFNSSATTFADIAFDMIVHLAREFSAQLGHHYATTMLKSLSAELDMHMDSRRQESEAPRASGGTWSNCPGLQQEVLPPNRHKRRFSTDGVKSCLPLSTRVMNNQPTGIPARDDLHNFSDLICYASEAVSLSHVEATALQRPTRMVAVPHPDFLPYLSLSKLFQLLICDPLREIERHGKDEELVVVLDNLDFFDKLHQFNEVQAVVDMLLHCTPPWLRMVVTCSAPFIPLTRSYLISEEDTQGQLVEHFILHSNDMGSRTRDSSSVTVTADIMTRNQEYALDLQDSVCNMIREVFPPEAHSSSAASSSSSAWRITSCEEKSTELTSRESRSSLSPSTSTNDSQSHEQHKPVSSAKMTSSSLCTSSYSSYESACDDILGILLPILDGSRKSFLLLHALLVSATTRGHSMMEEQGCGDDVKKDTTKKLLPKDVVLRTVSMFDYHAVMMEELCATTSSHERQLTTRVLEVVAASFESPPIRALEDMLRGYAASNSQLHARVLSLSMILGVSFTSAPAGQIGGHLSDRKVMFRSTKTSKFFRRELSERCDVNYLGVDPSRGHCFLTALYLLHSSNKSIAVDHSWQSYLKTYGPSHLHRSSRFLSTLTRGVRKIDETSGMKGLLPVQLGYISGLQELYARRVGIYGNLPPTIGCLDQLRVLSMGNNKISGVIPRTLGNLRHLQRIVLHQNKLSGVVPSVLADLGCIVNLAGNPMLLHGDEVPPEEKQSLVQLFRNTGGYNWVSNAGWSNERSPVSQWYKVGVLGSHVHSIVMSSNNMVGQLPETLYHLQELRMIELATMPGLRGPLPTALCELVNLRRLCICRCGISGVIPSSINRLVQLEELQLFGNALTGNIPHSLGDLVNLRLLSLGEYTGGNNFTPSPLPSCFSRLRKLEALFMANCRIKGPLPSWVGNLSELRQLDLQRNALSGSIPSGFQHLRALLYLNLKDNYGLTGPLPIFPLAKLTKLNRLSLVHCGFESSQERLSELQSNLPRCRIWI